MSNKQKKIDYHSGHACVVQQDQAGQKESQEKAPAAKPVNWWKRIVLGGAGVFFGLLILGWILGNAAPKYYVSGSVNGAGYGSGSPSYQPAQTLPQPSARLMADLAKLKGDEESLSTAEYWATSSANSDFATVKSKRQKEWTDAQNAWRADAQAYNAELVAEGLDKLPAAELKQIGLRLPIDVSQIPRWYTDSGQPIN